MSTLTAQQKAQLHEVADGMLKIYQTLVRMRYLEASWICEGPHDLLDHDLYEELGLDVSIIYLYSILPYIDTQRAAEVDFYDGSYFADFRDASTVRDNRNPMGGQDVKDHLRPWQTTLNSQGNHSGVLVYDARRHVVVMSHFYACGSTDANIDLREEGEEEELGSGDGEEDGEGEGAGAVENGGDAHGTQVTALPLEQDGDIEVEDEQDEGYNTDEDDWSDDGEQSEEDENNWEQIDARNAKYVLRDIVSWYEDLTETPGGGENTCVEWDPDLVRPLYIKHGWPNGNFDGDAFLIDHARAVAQDSAKFDMEELPSRIGRAQKTASLPARQRIPRPGEDEWLTKLADVQQAWFKLNPVACKSRWSDDEAKLARISAYPEESSLLLQEYEVILERVLQAHDSVEDMKCQTQGMEEARYSEDELRRSRSRLAYVERVAQTWYKAHHACREDLRRVCPGGIVTPDICHDVFLGPMEAAIEDHKEPHQVILDFIAQLPSSGADVARTSALNWAASSKRYLQLEIGRIVKLRSLVVEEGT